jgi:hypothetical protein
MGTNRSMPRHGLREFIVRGAADSSRDLVHGPCGEVLCGITDGDSLLGLSDMTREHYRECTVGKAMPGSDLEGIDPTRLKPGMVVLAAWDEDPGDESCHCSFLVAGEPESGEPVRSFRTSVIAHGLAAGDVVRQVISRGDEGDCHCDVHVVVDRPY